LPSCILLLTFLKKPKIPYNISETAVVRYLKNSSTGTFERGVQILKP
jgi:hypothetical protein